MKKLLASTLCFIFVGAINSFAQSLPIHTGEVGIEVYNFEYDEPGVMEEKGVMWGFLGSYTYHNDWMFKGEGRFAFGEVDYKNSGTLNDIDDYTFEFRGLAGHDFPILTASTLTPYFGFGYRYLNDDSSGMISSTGALGYERESNYFYSPLGIETLTELNNGWSVGVILEYDHFWKGLQVSHIGDAIAGISDLENDQNDGYGWRGSIKIQKKGEDVDYIIEPFIRYWDIDKSEETAVTYSGVIVGYGYEPANDTVELGIKVAARF